MDTFEEEEPIDMVALGKEMEELNQEIAESEAVFLSMLDELVVSEETKELIEAAKRVFQ